MPQELLFVLVYWLFVICLIFPPAEFASAGLTIQSVLSFALGNEFDDFILYHIKRTAYTTIIYSSIPALFFLGLFYFGDADGIWLFYMLDNWACKLIYGLVFLLPILAAFYLTKLQIKHSHPIIMTIKKFTTQELDWQQVYEEINREYRSINKVVINVSTTTTIIATENWIMKVTPLHVFIANQSDAEFAVENCVTHPLSPINQGETQFITIKVKSPRTEAFSVRINTMDFRDLQDRISRVIMVRPELNFHKNIVDKFIDAFKEVIQSNEKFTVQQEPDVCMGCMQVPANIKLRKMCLDNGNQNCTNCSCRPNWCVECMGRWFAHRQDLNAPDQWLKSKCTCPMCRATFCLLDISLIDMQ